MSEPAAHLAAVSAHVARHFGPVAQVFHELVSDELHIDVLVIVPSALRPFITLVTSGMSSYAMPVPAGVAAPARAELVLTLLPGHELSEAAFADEAVYWPVRKLKQMARWPMQLQTWFGDGHTMATEELEPVAPGVPFVALATLELLEVAARRLLLADGGEIAFYQVIALHREELEEKQRQGAARLHGLFDAPLLRVVYNTRINLCGDEHLERYRRGERLVTLAGWLLFAGALAEVIAAALDGDKLPWARFGFTLALAAWVGQGRRWARNLLAALVALAVTLFAGLAIAAAILGPEQTFPVPVVPVSGRGRGALIAVALQSLALALLFVPKSARWYYFCLRAKQAR